MDTAVVVGSEGAVGKALCAVLGKVHRVILVDVKIPYCPPFPPVDFLHIAIPYSNAFISVVAEYEQVFKPTATIIHSTVPIGTTRKLGAIHSPVMGQHDKLEESLTKFLKFISASEDSSENLQGAIKHLSEAGINCAPCNQPEDTEVLKLLCSLRLYNDLAFYEFAEMVMNKYGVVLPFLRVWTDAYNLGNDRKFTRPNLEFPCGKLGGTCIGQNLEMLQIEFDLSFLAELDK